MPNRRYTVPTWALLAIAAAALIGLFLLPAPAEAATYPPPLPLDELPQTGPSSDLASALAVLSIVIGAAVLVYAHLALSTGVLERARLARARRRV